MALWIVFALGCSGASIQGSVDGETPSSGEAFFVEEDSFYGNGDDRVQVFTADVDEACEAYAQLLDEVDDIDIGDIITGDYDDVETWWAETFPEDWWFTTITLRVDSLSGDLTVLTYDGADSSDGSPNEAGDARVEMVHYTAHQSVGGFLGGDDQRSYRSDAGSLEVSRWTQTERIRGSFSTTMVDDGGDTEGEITLNFDASHCPAAQAEVDN